jgi:hypothetical protein
VAASASVGATLAEDPDARPMAGGIRAFGTPALSDAR